MKFFIRFNYEPMHPIKDVLRILNEELEKKLISEGWNLFFVREIKTETIRGNFCREWECISLNLICLELYK